MHCFRRSLLWALQLATFWVAASSRSTSTFPLRISTQAWAQVTPCGWELGGLDSWSPEWWPSRARPSSEVTRRRCQTPRRKSRWTFVKFYHSTHVTFIIYTSRDLAWNQITTLPSLNKDFRKDLSNKKENFIKNS